MTNESCAVCGNQNPTFSLPLKRVKGDWIATPVCRKCRKGLIAEAKLAKKFLPIYGLEASLREAEKRNTERLSFSPFLEAFARDQKKVRASR